MTDVSEFETFMRAYEGMVYSTAVRLLGNETDALDIAQEVFVKAYKNFDALKDNPSCGGWLKTVARNSALNHLLRYRARWRFFSELFQGETGDQLDALVPVGDGRKEREEESHRRFHLERALQKLPASQRVPLVLYHFEELSYEAIAEQLGISLSKVKTDIHRARKSLKRWLKPDWDELDATDDAGSSMSDHRLERRLVLKPGWAGLY